MVRLRRTDDRRGDERLAAASTPAPLALRGTPRFAATSLTRSTTLSIASSVCAYSVLPNSSPAARSVASFSSHGRVRRPRASGLHGITPMPFLDAERHHLALLFAVDQVVVILHRDEPRPAVVRRRGRAPCANCQAYIDDAPM